MLAGRSRGSISLWSSEPSQQGILDWGLGASRHPIVVRNSRAKRARRCGRLRSRPDAGHRCERQEKGATHDRAALISRLQMRVPGRPTFHVSHSSHASTLVAVGVVVEGEEVRTARHRWRVCGVRPGTSEQGTHLIANARIRA